MLTHYHNLIRYPHANNGTALPPRLTHTRGFKMQVQAQLPAIEVTATAPVVAAPAKAITKAQPKNKPAPAKAKAADKPAKGDAKATPAKKAGAATKGAPKAAKSAIGYTLMQRPSSGGKLYAFTDAVLRLTGMSKGKAVNKALLTKIIGATAVRYHLAATMAFTTNDKGDIILSAGGKEFFATRAGKFSADDSTAYESILTTGQPNDLCKSANMINKVA